jgi:hypothetical protein
MRDYRMDLAAPRFENRLAGFIHAERSYLGAWAPTPVISGRAASSRAVRFPA